MAKRREKAKSQSELGVIVDLAHTINDTFEVLTGKTVPAWLEEFRQQPRELPPGEQYLPGQPVMPLADAYAVMGLPQTASMDQVKERYRVLARLFHPDAPGGYKEAMVLLNNAYEQIMKGRK